MREMDAIEGVTAVRAHVKVSSIGSERLPLLLVPAAVPPTSRAGHALGAQLQEVRALRPVSGSTCAPRRPTSRAGKGKEKWGVQCSGERRAPPFQRRPCGK